MASKKLLRIHDRSRLLDALQTKVIFFFTLVITVVMWPSGSNVVQAGASFTWTGEGDALTWTDACNWHPADNCSDTYPGKDNDDDVATIGPDIAHVVHPSSVTLSQLNLLGDASLQGGNITITDVFQWESGALAATITIPETGTLQVVTANDRRLEQLPTGTGQIKLYGSASWSDGGRIIFLGDTIFNNYGTFTVQGAATFEGFSCCVPPTSNFNNFGNFVVTQQPLPFPNSQVVFSALSFEHNGAVQVAEGATLTLGHGNHLLKENSTFSGGGRTILDELSGDPAIDGTVQLGPGHTFELRSNDLRGVGAFAGGGTFNWTGGVIRGNLTVAADTATVISGSGDKDLVRQSGQGELTTLGDVLWQDAGRIVFAGPGIFNSYGAFEVQDQLSMQALSCCVAPTATFNNFGSLHIENAGGAFKGVFVNTQGTVEVSGGQLEVSSGARYTQSVGTTRLDGAEVQANGGIYLDGGRLEGTGVITGTLYNSAAVHPGLPTGTLRVVGNYVQSEFSTLFIEIAGETADTEYDRLAITGKATQDGILDVSLLGGFVPEVNASFTVLTFGSRTGDFVGMQGLEIGAGKLFSPVYHPADLTLVVGEDAGADLRVTAVTLQQREVATGQWVDVGEEGTIDGNRLRVSATVINEGPARSGTMRLVNAADSAAMSEALPVELAQGTNEVALAWDSTGYAWTDGGEPVTDLNVKVELEASGSKAARFAPLAISPRPVVLVHGLWSDAQAWSNYGPFLGAHHPNWRVYAVGDGQFPGTMNTGSLLAPFEAPNTIYENAEILGGYIEALREAQNAWHVDIVAHSMGGLISRQYIQSLMPEPISGRPVIPRLVMLGTPNLGSQCALDFPFVATYELRPDVVAHFNTYVRNQRGVYFSILAGNPLPFTCSALVSGDSVVPVPSALALPYVTDSAMTGNLHTVMNTSPEDFETFVFPRLALGPNSALHSGVSTVVPALPYEPTAQLSTSQPQLILMETVEVVDSLSLPFTVPAADRFGVTLLAPPGVGVYLEDPQGTVVESIASGDSLAQEPIRALNVAGPAAGVWNLGLENELSAPVTAVVSTWVEGAPLFLDLAITPQAFAGQAHLAATLTENGAPITGSSVIAEITGLNGMQQEITLRDDGASNDGAVGDGVYGGTVQALDLGGYLVVVRADTGSDWRATTGSIMIRTHEVFLPFLRR